ncbi:hypothetical protein pb186bvf_003263 [Paramecium bursaria]
MINLLFYCFNFSQFITPGNLYIIIQKIIYLLDNFFVNLLTISIYISKIK